MSTLGAALDAAARRLAAAGIDRARAEARLLLAHASGLSPAALVGARERPLPAQTRARFEALVARRAAREPFAYIVGERPFWSLTLKVAPGVLVPRPETETLVEAALAAFPDREAALRILDLGTGSGCLLAALLHEYPRAFGVGVDCCPRALAIAAENLHRLGLAARAALVRGDFTNALCGPFDVIVSNPPYIASSELAALPPEVAQFEPQKALDGGTDGLCAFRALIPDLKRLLAPKGVACLEIGAGQEEAVAALAGAAGLRVTVRADLAGTPRCLVLRW